MRAPTHPLQQGAPCQKKSAPCALECALELNPAYSSCGGANCANCVSQCLHASGPVQAGEGWGRSKPGGKYAGKGAWKPSGGLFRWITGNGYGEPAKKCASIPPGEVDLQAGDLVILRLGAQWKDEPLLWAMRRRGRPPGASRAWGIREKNGLAPCLPAQARPRQKGASKRAAAQKALRGQHGPGRSQQGWRLFFIFAVLGSVATCYN